MKKFKDEYKAKIVGLDYDVINYKFNGRKRFIVEARKKTMSETIVDKAIIACQSFERDMVYNFIDKFYNTSGNPMPKSLENAIDRLTV